MKSTFQTLSILALMLSIHSASIAQQTKNFGQGIVIITSYSFAPGEAVPDAQILPDNKPTGTMRYYIKNDKILRSDDVDTTLTQTETTANSALNANQQTPLKLSAVAVAFKYLINYNQRQVLCYSYKQDFAAKFALKDFTYELFYRVFDRAAQMHIDTLTKTNPVKIAAQTCYKGMATLISTGEKVTFYYSTQKPALVSPLNAWFPNFPHNVMLITFATSWTNKDGTTGVGHLQYRVKSITNTNISDSTFTIPAAIPQLENVTLRGLLNISPVY